MTIGQCCAVFAFSTASTVPQSARNALKPIPCPTPAPLTLGHKREPLITHTTCFLRPDHGSQHFYVKTSPLAKAIQPLPNNCFYCRPQASRPTHPTTIARTRTPNPSQTRETTAVRHVQQSILRALFVQVPVRSTRVLSSVTCTILCDAASRSRPLRSVNRTHSRLSPTMHHP